MKYPHPSAPKFDGQKTPDNTLHIYIRVSTATQRDEGTSLNTQLEAGQRRAQSLGFNYTVWDEGGRSSNHEDVQGRPQLSALYSAICTGSVKHLYVYDQSRLSRSDGVASAFRYICNKHGVRLYTKNGEFDLSDSTDRLLNQILDAMAEFDNSARMDRAMTGRYKRARDGYWFGGKTPFGYEVKDRKLVVNEKEAKWVREMFRMRGRGESIPAIKRKLDDNKIVPRHAKYFSFRSIFIILRSRRYVGESILRDKRSNEVIHVRNPRIVSNHVWQNAQRELDLVMQKNVREQVRKQRNLLTELAFCGHCGRGINIRMSNGVRPLYVCEFRQRQWAKFARSHAHWKRNFGCGYYRGSPTVDIDSLVEDLVIDVFERYEEFSIVASNVVGGGATVALTESQQKFLSGRLESLEAERVAISEKDLSQRTWVGTKKRRVSVTRPEESASRLSVIASRIEDLTNLTRKADEFRQWSKWFKENKKIARSYRDLSMKEKKKFLDEILFGVEIQFVERANTHSISIAFKNSAIGKIELSLPPLVRHSTSWVRRWGQPLAPPPAAKKYARKLVSKSIA